MQEIRLNLTPLRKVLDILGSAYRKIPVISVAGTNGKGSVCAFIKAIMEARGIKAGSYTSPHFENLRERIKCKEEIALKEYDRIRDKIRYAEEKSGEKLTCFEFITAVAIVYFFEKNCPLSIMETGMGGTFDATNVCENKIVSVITPVDKDHTEFLGDKKEDIATQKAGIVSEEKPVIDASGSKSVEIQAQKLSAPLKKYGRDFSAVNITYSKDGYYSFSYISPERKIKSLKPSLRGSHQCINAAVAVAACLTVDRGISQDHIRQGIRNAELPGRLQFINLKDDKTVILDTAHNPAAIRALGEFMRQWLPGRGSLYTLMGVLKDKDYIQMINIIESISEKILVFTPSSDRGLDGEVLAAESLKAQNYRTFSRALRHSLKMLKPRDNLLICGSFKAVAPALKYFLQEAFK